MPPPAAARCARPCLHQPSVQVPGRAVPRRARGRRLPPGQERASSRTARQPPESGIGRTRASRLACWRSGAGGIGRVSRWRPRRAQTAVDKRLDSRAATPIARPAHRLDSQWFRVIPMIVDVSRRPTIHALQPICRRNLPSADGLLKRVLRLAFAAFAVRATRLPVPVDPSVRQPASGKPPACPALKCSPSADRLRPPPNPLPSPHAATFAPRLATADWRSTAQSTSALSSSHVTAPAVARSMAGQRAAGTGRTPFAHW